MGEVLADDLEVVRRQVPGPSYPSVDLHTQLGALGIRQRAALHAGLAGEVGEAVVHRGEAGGGSGDSGVVLVGHRGDPESLQQEEVEVDLDEAAGLPVEGEAVHDAQAGGPRQGVSARE